MNYDNNIILKKIIKVPQSAWNTLRTVPFELLPAINGYYVIVSVALDYDNIDIDTSGPCDWQIVNLTAFSLSGGNDNIMLFGWNNDTAFANGIMQGINGNDVYIRNKRNEGIHLTSNADDIKADFGYCNINILYTINA